MNEDTKDTSHHGLILADTKYEFGNKNGEIMNILTKYRSIPVLIAILLIFSTEAIAQVRVERSRDKVVISGVNYYIHPVRKGETVYSIARAYGITTQDLVRENPSAAEGLKEGQSIRIPERLVDTAPPASIPEIPQLTRNEQLYIYHKLQAGETVYRLSKLYNVSENDIVGSNPGIDISKLPVGHEIAIPRQRSLPPAQGTAGVQERHRAERSSVSTQEQRPFFHKVIRGETLSSIARRYRVTLRELKRENPYVRFPQVGDSLRIPGMKVTVPVAVEYFEAAIDTAAVEEIIYADTIERPSGITPVTSLTGSYNVAVMLPFYLWENSRRYEIDSSKVVAGKRVYREINRPDDWIYPRSLGFVEMYQGILLAADTLRSLGLNINIHAFDVKSDTMEAVRLIRSGRLDKMDLIIGPVYSENLAVVASYAGKLGIPVVSPVQLEKNTVLRDNPLLFLSISSLEVAQQNMAGKMQDYAGSNFIIIHSSAEEEVKGAERIRNLILDEISQIADPAEIRIRDITFYSRSTFGGDSINRLANSLSDTNRNVIVIASEDPPVMSETITNIHALARKYQLDVFAYPGMRYLDNLDHRICFDLGLMIYSPYWIDYSHDDVIRFNKLFREKFLTEPPEISYAWQGYDVLYYFLSGMAIHGKELFLSHPRIHNPDMLHTDFDFRRRNPGDGFETQKLFLVRYSKNYELELVESYNQHITDAD
ncbi:MAG TPA: LysM peptidoglycan-binding domain-containing protein [Bacteroidales bacterium]|jgi:LysM repeat protein/ABC-type branched-subunit amino acid transport system substrate-binding protein|nr:LysM peptidoglycan-binding domain-containing protein [Bacteroidales bacterium]HNY53389.1 LysM peptidoglycan-binding domain-containing protein [Bacteroidales bacterium]HOG57470.1 LysM peptidoglycan-binding domain-containing protein [Bacteroidales bacterium]HPB13431.1 LysM peptidoglycan-binding domain-containing protein [Bacteroidales bacterium]HPV16027.1 LysM peptidoglycan-binding domain-containing protein [Bacteroidales bacterium]